MRVGGEEHRFSFLYKRPEHHSCTFKWILARFQPCCQTLLRCGQQRSRGQMATPAKSTTGIILERVGERGEDENERLQKYPQGWEWSCSHWRKWEKKNFVFSVVYLNISFGAWHLPFCLFLHRRLIHFPLLGLKHKSLLRVGRKCQPTFFFCKEGWKRSTNFVCCVFVFL